MNDYTTVADLYDSYVTDTRDHAFWSHWAGRSTGPILELTAGTGRATEPLCRASGWPLVALDLAPAMLARLAVRFACATPPVRVVAATMTCLPFASRAFHLVVIPFNSLGEIVDPQDRAATLHEVRRVLAPCGRAIVTLHDPTRRKQTLDGSLSRLGPFPSDDARLEVLVRGRLVASDVAESEQTYRLIAAGGRVVEERRLTLRFALPDVDALGSMAADAGLQTEALFGDYDQSPYVPGASPFILAVLAAR